MPGYIGFQYKYQWTDFRNKHLDIAIEVENETRPFIIAIERQIHAMKEVAERVIAASGLNLPGFLVDSIREYRARTVVSGTRYNAQYVEDLKKQLEVCQEEKNDLVAEVERLTTELDRVKQQLEVIKEQKRHYKGKFLAIRRLFNRESSP